jgi:hypothetical protein
MSSHWTYWKSLKINSLDLLYGLGERTADLSTSPLALRATVPVDMTNRFEDDRFF